MYSCPNIEDGRKVVAAAGTAERLASTNTPCKKVIIQAEDTNTGAVVIGGANVDAAAATRRGIALYPDTADNTETRLELHIEDLYEIWIDAEQNGDGVTFTYLY